MKGSALSSSSVAAADGSGVGGAGHFWEAAFVRHRAMWGERPTVSAQLAFDVFQSQHHRSSEGRPFRVLIPGIGYGRNALPFLQHDMHVTGIEVSQSAIDLARSQMNLSADTLPIHHGSVLDMPFDNVTYDGIFAYGLLHLLDAPEQRYQLLHACFRQLAPGGHMVFTVISNKAAQYGQGVCVADETYEQHEGCPIFYYNDVSIAREFAALGWQRTVETNEPHPQAGNSTMPCLNIICRKEVMDDITQKEG